MAPDAKSADAKSADSAAEVTWFAERVTWYPSQRQYSRRELAFDAAINVLGVAAASVGGGALLLSTSDNFPWLLRATLLAYVCSTQLCLACSLAYNSLAWLSPRAVRWLKLADHCGILALNVGSFGTPLALAECERMLVSLWLLAVCSAWFKWRYPSEVGPVQVACFLAMGWAPVCVWQEVSDAVTTRARTLGLCAGLCYSSGLLPFACSRLEGHTAVWHAFVLAGCAAVLAGHFELAQTDNWPSQTRERWGLVA